MRQIDAGVFLVGLFAGGSMVLPAVLRRPPQTEPQNAKTTNATITIFQKDKRSLRHFQTDVALMVCFAELSPRACTFLSSSLPMKTDVFLLAGGIMGVFSFWLG